MPVVRRGHWRINRRSGERVWVSAHTMTMSGSDTVPDTTVEQLRAQAQLAAHLDGNTDRDYNIPEGYTVLSSRLTETGNNPGSWWTAQSSTITDANVVQMPEEYSPSSERTGRRTHRIQYQMGQTKVRMPSRAAVRRFIRAHPNMTAFEIPVEGVAGQRRGFGMLRMTRNEETGRWEVTDGTGAFSGDSDHARRVRESFVPVTTAQRRRASQTEAAEAAANVEATTRTDPESASEPEISTTPVPDVAVDTGSYCAHCGEPAFTTANGVSHHEGDTFDGVDYDLDADHTAILATDIDLDEMFTESVDNRPEDSTASPLDHCPDCGEFIGSTGHDCLGRTVPEPPVSEPEPISTAADPPSRTIGVIQNSRANFYRATGTDRAGERMTIPSISTIRRELRQSPTGMVNVNFRHVSTDHVTVSGQVRLVRRADGTITIDTHNSSLHRTPPEGVAENTFATIEAMVNTRGTLRSSLQDVRDARENVNRTLDGGAARAQTATERARSDGRYEQAPSWLADPELFQAEYDALKEARDRGEPILPYMRENATAGLGAPNGGRSFGVEIEFNLDNPRDPSARRRIVQEIRNLGILHPSHPDGLIGWSAADSYGYQHWKLMDDGTVNGGELVSPVLYDTPETWEQLEQVCEIIRRHGGTAKPSGGSGGAGGHIHVGLGDYDDNVELHTALLSDVNRNADLINRLAAYEDDGSHRGQAWCAPNSPVPAAGFERLSHLRGQNSSHSIGLNFESVGGTDNDHVEFRQWNGSLDPAVIQARIKMSLAITEAAMAGRNVPEDETEPIGSHLGSNPRRNVRSGEDWENSTRSLRRAADSWFHRPEDRRMLVGMFLTTRRWGRASRSAYR